MALLTTTQLFESVTSTEYVLAERPVIVSPVCPLDQRYVYGATPVSPVTWRAPALIPQLGLPEIENP